MKSPITGRPMRLCVDECEDIKYEYYLCEDTGIMFVSNPPDEFHLGASHYERVRKGETPLFKVGQDPSRLIEPGRVYITDKKKQEKTSK